MALRNYLTHFKMSKKYKTGVEMGRKKYDQENEKTELKISLTDQHPLTRVNTMPAVVKSFPYCSSLDVSISHHQSNLIRRRLFLSAIQCLCIVCVIIHMCVCIQSNTYWMKYAEMSFQFENTSFILLHVSHKFNHVTL